MASPVSTNRWDLSGWTSGSVTLFQALGIKKGTIQYPKLQTVLTAPAATAATAQQTQSATNAANAVTSPSAVSSGPCTAAQTSANKTLGQQLATAFNSTWGSGQQWTDLNNIVMGESGWCNTAQNPGSTAYGIGQFLDTTWASTGYTKTSSPKIQILAMLAYIKMRYGSPSAAWAFHQANGYY